MADNTILDANTSVGDTIASDDIAGVKYPRGKLSLGADGSAIDAIGGSGVVSSAVQRVVLATDQPQLTNALKVDGSAVTQPVSVASLPLPTGAATEATLDARTGSLTEAAPATDTASSGLNGRLQRLAQKFTSLIALFPSTIGNKAKAASLGVAIATDQVGPAGTAATDVLTVQGIASMTKLLVTPDSVALPANQSVNAAQVGGTAVDTNSGTKSAGTIRVVLATDQPQLTNKLLVTPDANSAVNVAQINGVTPLMGAGAVGTGSLRTTLASDDPAVATLGATTGAKVITDANGTIQQYLRGLIYQLITAGTSFFTPVPDTANGWTVAMFTSADGSTALTNAAQVVKASAGKLGGYYIYNPNAAATYVHLYNVAAASVTVGTTNPLITLCIPATSAANVELAMGVPFSNAGWSISATTTGGGNTAPTTALEAVIYYK